MLNRFFGAKTHSFLHSLGLCGLAFGIPMNKVVMSVSMMFLVLNLLLEGDFTNYWKRIKTNRFFHLIFVFFLFHAVSLLWSNNIDYGIHDLKVKLPLFIVPLVLAARPIVSRNDLNFIFGSFLLSITITSTINYFSYLHLIGNNSYDDIRGMSLFGSHVRYSLLVVMGIGITIHTMIKKDAPLILVIILFVWLNYYTYYSQVLSGMISLLAVYTILIVFLLWKKRKVFAIAGFAVISVLISLSLIWLFKPISYNASDYDELPKKTLEGNFYYHMVSGLAPETGKPIFIYVCPPELEREWNKVSSIPFDSLDIKGQKVSGTLIRYMASRDLTKDAEGFKKLKPEEILLIENGNASYLNTGVMARINGLRFQLNNKVDPNSHSFLQRLEYWKAATHIAKNNLALGVGIGDVQQVFDARYNETDSPLTAEKRDRAHNMYLTILLSLGVLGLILLLWSHIGFMVFHFNNRQLIPVLFISIILVSYIMEDTLETQTGVTFFALFYGLFSHRPKKVSKS